MNVKVRNLFLLQPAFQLWVVLVLPKKLEHVHFFLILIPIVIFLVLGEHEEEVVDALWAMADLEVSCLW
jgi:hypothetical protein